MSYVFFIALSFVLCISPTIYAGDVNVDLFEAAAKGEITRVKNLLAKGADVNARSDSGVPALMIAAVLGHATIVEALLAKGADVNARLDNGRTALMIAAEGGHTTIMEALLAKGADNARNKDGMTALMWAEKQGRSLSVQLLKKAGDKN